MEQNNLHFKQNITFFWNMVACDSNIFGWEYDETGKLLNTNCPTLALDTVFRSVGCMDYMQAYAQTDSRPLLLSADFGLTWIAAFENNANGLTRMQLLGPMSSAYISDKTLEQVVRRDNTGRNFHTELIGVLRQVPAVSNLLFFKYGLMLHYFITGEKLQQSEIQLQKGRQKQNRAELHKNMLPKNRGQIYMSELALLQKVREGDLDYQSSIKLASELSSGVRVTTQNPIEQVRISLITFTSLCVRAAIEGGLSPEAAHTLGDSYIQTVLSYNTVSDLAILNHEMYEDFIKRVHDCRKNPKLSPQIQSCCDYIALHLQDDLSLSQLAERVYYTDYYLSRKFKKEMGVGIHEYIRTARMKRAKTWLATTNKPIAEIAETLQFCSSSHFSDAFKEIEGVLPQKYRNENKPM